MKQVTGISIYSQNINGLSNFKFTQLLTIFRHYDIIVLQETHVTQTMAQTFIKQLEVLNWNSYWGAATRINKRPQGGVTIWIKKQLFSHGIILSCTQLRHPLPRHLLSLDIRCRDQHFVLSAVYMPMAREAETVDQCIKILSKLARRKAVLWCGDFNFVEDQRDTTSKSDHRHSYTYRKWTQRIGKDLVREASQHSLRRQKAFTHYAASTRQKESPTGSRLDRIYCSSQYLPLVSPVKVIRHPTVHSDHLPVSASIKLVCPRLRRDVTTPQRRNCIPHQFLKNPRYRAQYIEEMGTWIQSRIANARIDYQLWLSIKKKMSSLAIQLNRAYRQEEYAKRQSINNIQHEPSLVDVSFLHKEDAHVMLPQFTYDLTIPGLTQRNSRITASGKTCANILVDQYAKVSEQPLCSVIAQQRILHSLSEEDKRVFPHYFNDMTTEITEEEIIKAINSMRTSSPGEDGIKISLYRPVKQVLAPILTQVFTQLILAMPEDFLYGIIIPIHKQGSKYEAANYRPITLLNTDYRIMQQILLAKLRPPLQQLVPSTQSAFLPGRCISDTIWTIQMLPPYLSMINKSAYFAVCDFSKAYDKIDRNLLFRLCSALQIPRFLALWIQQILSCTCAKVYVNGVFSHKRRFYAGVRQGDPVSPYLYLLISHLLTRHLQQEDIYLQIPMPLLMHHHHHGLEKANMIWKLSALQYADDNTIPLAPNQIEPFLNAMDTFAAATGQQLNKRKTWLLPIGQSTPQPASIQGLKVVSSATILGIQIQANTGQATFDWAPRINSFRTYCRLLSDQLSSSFTKFSRLSTYKLPQELYRAEVVRPSEPQLAQLYRCMRSLLPSKTGWSSIIFPANPKMGGLGCLPLKEHLHARDLKWVSQLFTLGTSKVWVQLVWNIFVHYESHYQAARTEDIQALPTPLRALIQHVYWERHLGNHSSADRLSWIRRLWRQLHTDYQLRQHTLGTSATVLALLPCLTSQQIQPQWERDGEILPLEDYTVKFGTLLLTENSQSQRETRWFKWLEIIQDKRASDSSDCGFAHPIRWRPLYRVLKPLQRLQIPSAYKVAFWETIMQTSLTSERIHVDHPCICPSSPARPGRAHFFYQCPIAHFLYQRLFNASLDEVQDIIRSIWLGSPRNMYLWDAWAFISIASTYSIDTVRKKIYKDQQNKRVHNLEYYQQLTLKVCIGILTRYTHVLEEGSPSMASSAPLQWSEATKCWLVSPLVSRFSHHQDS